MRVARQPQALRAEVLADAGAATGPGEDGAPLGGVAPGVVLTDATAAGATGPLPVRTYRPAGPSAERPPVVVNFCGASSMSS